MARAGTTLITKAITMEVETTKGTTTIIVPTTTITPKITIIMAIAPQPREVITTITNQFVSHVVGLGINLQNVPTATQIA